MQPDTSDYKQTLRILLENVYEKHPEVKLVFLNPCLVDVRHAQTGRLLLVVSIGWACSAPPHILRIAGSPIFDCPPVRCLFDIREPNSINEFHSKMAK